MTSTTWQAWPGKLPPGKLKPQRWGVAPPDRPDGLFVPPRPGRLGQLANPFFPFGNNRLDEFGDEAAAPGSHPGELVATLHPEESRFEYYLGHGCGVLLGGAELGLAVGLAFTPEPTFLTKVAAFLTWTLGSDTVIHHVDALVQGQERPSPLVQIGTLTLEGLGVSHSEALAISQNLRVGAGLVSVGGQLYYYKKTAEGVTTLYKWLKAKPPAVAPANQVATNWRQHEQFVTQSLQNANPGRTIGSQVTLDVTNNATGQTVRIRIDNLALQRGYFRNHLLVWVCGLVVWEVWKRPQTRITRVFGPFPEVVQPTDQGTRAVVLAVQRGFR